MIKNLWFILFLFSFSKIHIGNNVYAEINRGINNIAENINVLIYSPSSNASGVLVKKDLNQYLVLTAWHVLQDVLEGDEIDIKTNDGIIHPFVKGSIKKIENVDLGLISFKSSSFYELAEIGNVEDSEMSDKIYVFGYPLPNSSVEKSLPRLQPGEITASSNSFNKDGYQLLYTNKTLPGMSGGSILNLNGELIGIHGRSEISETQSLGNKLISTGTNLGIPIYYFENYILEKQTNIENKSSKADDFLIKAFNLLGEEDNSLKMYMLAKRSVDIKPNALGFTLMGISQSRLKDKNAAIENYKNALALNPNIELANKYLAPYLSNENAIEIYDKLIKNFPNKNEYFYLRAMSKHKNGDLKESLKDLEKGIKIYKKLKSNYCNENKPDFIDSVRLDECGQYEYIHTKLLERAGNTLFVLNETKNACFYWQDKYENYRGSSMWEYHGYWRTSLISPTLEYQDENIKKFVANNDNYNAQRAFDLSKTIFNQMDLAKYVYKYCL